MDHFHAPDGTDAVTRFQCLLRTGIAALAWISAAAQAQPAAAHPPPDPLDAQAAVPPLQHRSALAGYRRAAEVPLGSWRDANDTVTRIGGWKAYAREAAAPAPAASAAPPHGSPHAPTPPRSAR